MSARRHSRQERLAFAGSANHQDGIVLRVDEALVESSISAEALPFVLAARTLKDGDSISTPVFTFQSSTGHVFPNKFAGVVSSGSFQRAGATAPEPVWIISSNGGYAANYTIAKGDRLVLKMILQQGDDGTQVDTYSGPLKQ